MTTTSQTQTYHEHRENAREVLESLASEGRVAEVLDIALTMIASLQEQLGDVELRVDTREMVFHRLL